MTDRVETDAWVVFYSGSDTVKVYFENVSWEPIHDGKRKHYDGGVNIGIPVYKTYVVLFCSGGWLNSEAKITNYIAYLKTWLNSGNISVKVSYDGTNFQKLDGTNTIFPMMPKKGLGIIEKVAHSAQEIYYIDEIILEQTGVAS